MIDIPRKPNTLWDRQLLGNHLQNINKLIHIPKNVILLSAKILGLYTIMTRSHTLRETLGKKEFQNIYLQQFDKTEFALKNKYFALHKMCPYSELFWSVFSHTRTEYREILRISSYSFRMRENADQNNSEYGQFSHSVEFGIFSS